MISVYYLIREYLVWELKVAGVDTGNIFRWRTMAASFPIVTVLISPEWGSIYRNDFSLLLDTWIFGLGLEGSWCWHWKYFPLENDGSFVPHSYGVDISNSIYRNEFCELLDTIIFGLVFEGSWCCTGNIFRWRTMAASFPIVTVLISPEWGSIYRNDFWYYLIREYLVWELKVAGVDTGNIFRWRTMAASFPIVTVLISPEWGSIYRNDFSLLLDTWIFGLGLEGSWCWHWKYFPLENDGSFVPHSYGVDISNSIYRNEFCELFDTIIFGLVFEGSWCLHWKYFPLENDGSFVPHSYGVDISWVR